jgi:hypothetical protein
VLLVLLMLPPFRRVEVAGDWLMALVVTMACGVLGVWWLFFVQLVSYSNLL